MMMAPQVVGVLLKKPGQQAHPRVGSLDPQETKIRGELYVEELSERRMVSIRMGWLWVEGTPMRLPLRALNLRQAGPSICQPHALALGFTLSNSQGDNLATFWTDTEPIYWSWVRAVAAELVRQTPFRAQRCLNFLEILTICPRGPVPLPESPTETRRRSRSELRCWLGESPMEKTMRTTTILDDSRRRARSELRGWSSNSSDEDLLVTEFQGIPGIVPKEQMLSRTWGCSESSEGSDDSLPWGGGQSSVDSVDSVSGSTASLPEPETREQRIERYKEARRRENEARSRRVLEEDARRRRARAEENNNNLPKSKRTSCQNDGDKATAILLSRSRMETSRKDPKSKDNQKRIEPMESTLTCPEKTTIPDRDECSVRFQERNDDDNNNNRTGTEFPDLGNVRIDQGERKSRTRERRSVRERVHGERMNAERIHGERLNVERTLGERLNVERTPGEHANERLELNGDRVQLESPKILDEACVNLLQEGKEKFVTNVSSTIPIPRQQNGDSRLQKMAISSRETSCPAALPRSGMPLSILVEPCEEDVARLLERCQRVDHYVPVKDKLTLFESLSRLGGRLARSTEDLGRSSSKPSPRGKQRARSLHDLNRGLRAVPVREMCRLFEGSNDRELASQSMTNSSTKSRFSDPITPTRSPWNETVPLQNGDPGAGVARSSIRRKLYPK
ncbi:uncharacterized protein LOC105696324 [Orussus abietinus]|uniref:uncharacterized protein LOC105696324 n=1 Tax=Orussus abietinus TaxID=222816 RepID=UPI00062606D0|nr:uncharacterized protein LOC105696324 [Orussus abietinus]